MKTQQHRPYCLLPDWRAKMGMVGEEKSLRNEGETWSWYIQYHWESRNNDSRLKETLQNYSTYSHTKPFPWRKNQPWETRSRNMLLLLPQPRGTTGTLPCNLHAASQPVPCPPFPALKYPNLTLFAPRCLSQYGLLQSCFFFPLLPAPQLLFSHFVKQDLLLLFVQLCQELRVNIHITQNLLQHGDSKKTKLQHLLPIILTTVRKPHGWHSGKQLAKGLSHACLPRRGLILALFVQAYSTRLLQGWSSLLISSSKGEGRCQVKRGRYRQA